MQFTTIHNGMPISLLEAILLGVDGQQSLYVPIRFPQLNHDDYSKMQEMSYAERFAYIFNIFFEGEIDYLSLKEECDKVLCQFAEEDAIPFIKLDKHKYITELYYGPSYSFQDLATFIFPFILQKAYQKYGQNKKIFALAVGDVNSIASVANFYTQFKNMHAVLFFPNAFSSHLQKLALASKINKNVQVVAVDNADLDMLEREMLDFLQENRQNLERENILIHCGGSWNILTILAQMVYYISSYIDLFNADEISRWQTIDYVIPMENYTNLIALYYVKAMGLPIQNIVVGCNVNSVLCKAIINDIICVEDTQLTIAPAMDSQVLYNLFRLLYFLDKEAVAKQWEECMECKKITLTSIQKAGLKKGNYFVAAKEENQIDSMYTFFEEYDYLIDTHTACAVHAYETLIENRSIANNMHIFFATVHPYKYPQDTMYAITGEDIKDTFKALKHLELSTAMKVPTEIKKLRTLKSFAIPSISHTMLKNFLINLLQEN